MNKNDYDILKERIYIGIMGLMPVIMSIWLISYISFAILAIVFLPSHSAIMMGFVVFLFSIGMCLISMKKMAQGRKICEELIEK